MFNAAAGGSGALKILNEFAEFSACRAVVLLIFLDREQKPLEMYCTSASVTCWSFTGGFAFGCK
jgi:hypothetical protein